MEHATVIDVAVISESEDEDAVEKVTKSSNKAGDATRKESVSPKEISDDDVVAVPLDQAIVAKQKEILRLLPFIEEVKKAFASSLSTGQASRLDALVRLVQRDNVTMSTLQKIESIIMKLETKFGEVVRSKQASGSASGNLQTSLAQRRLNQKSEVTDRKQASDRESTAAATNPINNHKKKDSRQNTNKGPTKRKQKPSRAARGDTISISSTGSESEDPKESTNRKSDPQSRPATSTGPSTAGRKSVPLVHSSPSSNVAEEAARRSFASSSPSLSSNKPSHKNIANEEKTQGTTSDHKRPDSCKSNTSQKTKEDDRPPLQGEGVLAAIRAARELDREQKQARELANKERAKTRSLQLNAGENLGFSRRSNTGPATAKAAITQKSAPLFTRGSSVPCDQDSTSVVAMCQSTPNQRLQQQQPSTEPSNGSLSLCDKDANRSDTPASPLSEARKKLAAMLLDKLDPPAGVGAGLGVPCTLPLASNSMDPRGRNLNYNSNTLCTAGSNVLGSPPPPPPSVTRDTSPVPPAPPMKAGSVWTPIPVPGAGPGRGSMGFASRGSRGAHARPPHIHHENQRPVFSGGETQSSGPAPHVPNGFHAVDPRLNPHETTRDPRESRDPRGPRFQNMPRPNHQQQHQNQQQQQHHQQQQGYTLGNPTNWQSSSWNNNEQIVFNGLPGCGLGPGSVPGPRPHLVGGSFRGGHESRGRGGGVGVGGISHRYIPPARGRGGSQYDAPRTYREHREAKAREKAAAAAKVAEMQRLADIEKKRLLEATEKQRQQEERDSAAITVPVTSLPDLQLDTSYRNVIVNNPAKKIDFRIPKKTTTAAATASTTVQSMAIGTGGEIASSTTSPPASKSSNDNDKDKSTDNDKDAPATDNNSHNMEKENEKQRNSPKDLEKPERAEKKSKSKDAERNKNISKDEDKSKKEVARAEKKANKKKKKKFQKLQKENDNNRTEKNEQKKESDKKATSSSTPASTSTASSASTAEIIEQQKISINEPNVDDVSSHTFSDNVENEPPMVCTSLGKAPEGKPKTPEVQSEDAAAESDLKETKTEVGSEAKPDDAPAAATSTANDSESDEKVRKLSKMKIVLGPNGHSTFLVNDDDSMLLDNFGQKFKVKKNGDENENGSGKKEGPPVNSQIHKIMRRRCSMAPTASRPLVDKASIFNGSSLMYEDLTEQKRKEEKQSLRARHLANIFEKTSDNCRVSTQNIISGKRRTRCIPDCSFNETMLSRNRFGLGQIVRTAKATPEEKKRRTTPVPPPVKRKRGRPPASVKKDIVQDAKRPRLEIEEVSTPVKAKDSEEQSVAPTIPPPSPPPTAPAPSIKTRARKRNELEKLTEYISSMYNGEDVTRASGRRACTVPQAQRRSVTPAECVETTTTSPSSSRSPSRIRRPIPREIRNMARRGRSYGTSSMDSGGINRASTVLRRNQMRVRKCCVRLRRFPMPQKNAPNVPKQPTPQRKEQQRKRTQRSEPNVNPEWHANSIGAVDCVVCHKNIGKNPSGHYLQCHKENYISRLAPGMLDELRAERCNQLRPAAGDPTKKKYDYRCPFCLKELHNFTFNNIASHLIEHTGESKAQCSSCRQPIRRKCLINRHRRYCTPDAQIVTDKRTCQLPLTLHVCPLCDYVQTGQERRDAHLVKQHRLSDELIAAMELERVTLCWRSTDKKPPANETESEAAPNISVPKMISRRSSVMCPKTHKKKIRFKKQLRKPEKSPKREQESQEEEGQDGMPASQEMEEIKVPPPGGQEDVAAESILVVNECLMDIDADLELDIKLLGSQMEEDIEQAESRLHEKLMEEKPVLTEIIPMETEEDTATQKSPAKPSEEEGACCSNEIRETVVPAVPVEVEIRGLSVDPLMGIGSDDSDSGMDVDVDGNGLKTASASTSQTVTGPGLKDVDDDRNKRVPGDWEDLVETGSQDESRSKSIFRKFNRFYSRLTNGTAVGVGGGTGSGGVGGSPRRSLSHSTQSTASNSSECDPSELMPEMRALEPVPTAKAARKTPIMALPPLVPISYPNAALKAAPTGPVVKAVPAKIADATVPTPAETTAMSAPTRVENVAYRMRNVKVPQSAVYCCQYPGCSFLFSNEREGLERHFAVEHPQVSWSGSCFACITQDPTKALLMPPSCIGDELRHLAEEHMPTDAANPPEKPPKLRVRRFSGDLLTNDARQQQRQQTNVSIIPADMDGDTSTNVMLRDLLKATPRPINQQADLNASGLGEFLCAKSVTPSSGGETETQAPTATSGNGNANENGAALYNNKENTGLQIVTVCHLDALPSLQPLNESAEPALATVSNGDFVFTQSISENHINICLEPSAAEMVATEATGSTTRSIIQPIDSDSGRNCIHLAQDRFRCMAVSCGYCAHTVLCIREHMNFHRFSFGSTDYLKCGYCTHVASDVDDYVRHGVYVHGLAPRHELHADSTRPAGEMSVSQQIREALSQRRNALPTTVPTVGTAPVEPSSSSGQAQGNETTPRGGVTISKVLYDYLQPTGYTDDNLFECPEKTCGARLTSESFVKHILYHIRSSSSRRETELVKCRFCRALEMPPMLRQHLLTQHARHRYICSQCLETAASMEMLMFHVKQVHPQVLGQPNHSFKTIQVFLQEGNGKRAGHRPTVCHVLGLLMPFEHAQLQTVKHRVIRELKLREARTKNVFRSSEAKLLPSCDTVLTVALHCAECLFVSKEVVDMQRHLAMHKLQTINAFTESQRLLEAQPSSAEKQPTSETTQPAPVIRDVAAAATTTNTTTTTTTDTAIATATAAAKGGLHKVVNPYVLYVPSQSRFVCGALGCSRHLPSLEALCKHMTKEHMYTDVLWCSFCRTRLMQPQPNKMSIAKYLRHLSTHKRYMYQCGDCGRANSERHFIERHIIDRHLNLNVDVVIHRQIARLQTTARWIKLPKLSRNPNHNQYLCNLCQHLDNSMEKIAAHAEAVHGIKNPCICSVPQCSFGSKDPILAIQHMLDEHPGVQVQPALIYQHTLARTRQTMGFYCCKCRLAFPSFQRTVSHLKESHECLCQYKCAHCDFNCQQERGVIVHMMENHPGLKGLAECQFERVLADLPDYMAWAEAHPIEESQHQQQGHQQQQQQMDEDQEDEPHQDENEESEEPEVQEVQLPPAANPKITEVIDLLDSDDEAQTETAIANREPFSEGLHATISERNRIPIESRSDNNFYVFSCGHCGFIAANLAQLKSQHCAQTHPNRAFIFRVQPLLLCCLCKSFKSNAKEMREHLITTHRRSRQIKTVACDVRRPRECGFCCYQYQGWADLISHMEQAAHQINDLKNVTESGLEVLLKLNRSESGAEYYQICSLCKKVLPDQIAMYHHGQQEHADQGFSFTNVHPLVYHCFYCVFTSLEEMASLRHMITHFGGFQKCHYCAMPQPGGFEQYIQHCYTSHHEEVGRFRQVYTYPMILRFLLQTAYQFQNGLIINKSSLLNTRHKKDTLIRQLYEELMARAERPPIPRIHIGLKNVATIANGMEPVAKKAKIIRRRQTLGPDELIRARLLDEPSFNQSTPIAAAVPAALAPSSTPGHSSRPANYIWSTSFTGANPAIRQQPPPSAAAAAVVAEVAPSRQNGEESIIRNLKRRNSVVVFSRP
ncbi:uncharacterized protein LOC117902543 [Drosophila subobscura]|uniref:uncharacterized protein LOC117902543 n=1 Tax=Drosophila subobscura TaxID=7241 RepID=UPI00155A4C62|nr:uncharacterized protein LOC117902543 [Drosophila subobscura]